MRCDFFVEPLIEICCCEILRLQVLAVQEPNHKVSSGFLAVLLELEELDELGKETSPKLGPCTRQRLFRV